MYERILLEMKIKGIKYIADLEKMAGLSNGSIKAIKNGHMPSSERLTRIANALGVSVDYIVNGKEDIVQEKNIEPKQLKNQSSDSIREFFTLVASLSDQNMEALLDYLKYLVGKQERD